MATYSGTIDLRVTGDAEQKAELIKKRINEIKSIANSLKPVPNLFDKRGNDAILKAKENLRKLVEQYGKGTGTGNRFSNTIAGLNQQMNGFSQVLGNVNIKSDEFAQALTASEKVSRRLARAEAARLKVQTEINTANTVGRATSVQETLDLSKVIPKSIAGLDLYQRELEETLKNVRIGSKDYRDLSLAIADVNRQLAIARGQGPVQGPALPPGFNESGRIPETRRRQNRFQDIATGAGFPLLFGGGPAQVLAGGIGGAFGGFGGAIAASAIASQVEAFAQAAAQTGQALNSTGGALDLMREKSLFSTSAIEERAAVLEEQGRVEELAALLTQELTDKIGNNGVEALQDLGKETDETTRLWNELTLQLQALIASNGPLRGFIDLINTFLGGLVNKGRLAALQKDLEGTQAGRRLGAEIKRIRPETSFVDEFLLGSGQADLTDPQVTDLLKRYTPLRPKGATVPVTAADQQRFAVKPKAGKVDKAAREEARLRERLAKLRLEREEIAKITEFKDRIAAAEAVQDQLTARRIQGEQSVYEVQQAGLRALVGITDQREIQEIKLLTAEKVTAKLRDTERELLTIQRERDKLFKDTMENLELQLAIETATTREEAEQLRITQEMKALEGKGLSQDQLSSIRSAKESLSKSQEPLNKFINDSTKALNDFQTLGVTVAQGVGDAFATAMTTGVQELVRGTKSAEEVFADFLNNIANTLMQVAQQMIATYIAIGIAKAFAGMGGGGGETTPPTTMPGASVQTGGGLNINGVDQSIAPKNLAAEGGYFGSPTNALIGEGGEPEYVIPESKMRESMARYSRGARGGSVIPEAGGSGTSGEGGGTAVAAPIDVRYTVERINSVDYVTADQFQAGMRQAASQGAKQGEQQTLKRLQMSSSTRKRIGM